MRSTRPDGARRNVRPRANQPPSYGRGSNGFIAAFVAGFMLGVKTPAVREQMQTFGETEGTILSLLVMLSLGLVLADLWRRRIG